MTVLSLQRLTARPRRRIAVPRHLRVGRRLARRDRRTYRDSFFADPAVVEDDARRMMHRFS
jgi:hypothetical protein